MQSRAARVVVVLLVAIGALGAAATGVVILLVALFVFTAMSTPHPGAPVAERIRAADSPIVLEVRYQPAVFGASIVQDSLVVMLTDDATEAQALDLWCTVIVPAGGDRIAPDILRVEQGEKTWPGGGTTGGHTVLPRPTNLGDGLVYVQPACPPGATPEPSP
jgi:hypothetical protein